MRGAERFSAAKHIRKFIRLNRRSSVALSADYTRTVRCKKAHILRKNHVCKATIKTEMRNAKMKKENMILTQTKAVTMTMDWIVTVKTNKLETVDENGNRALRAYSYVRLVNDIRHEVAPEGLKEAA